MVWKSPAQRANIKGTITIRAAAYKFLTHHSRNITIDSDDHVLAKLSIEANNLGHGDHMAHIQGGRSISNRLLDPTSIHFSYLPKNGDLEISDCFRSSQA
jgi:hypothetical protein